MQWTAVVRNDHGAMGEGGCLLEDIAVVAVDRKLSVLFRNRLGLLPLAGAGEQNDRISIVGQTLGELSVGLVTPMFRAAVKSAGVESEQRPVEPDAEGAEALARSLAGMDRQADARNLVDDARRVPPRHGRTAVLELMSTIATAADAVRQQQPARI